MDSESAKGQNGAASRTSPGVWPVMVMAEVQYMS